jgi:hypothetical protein
MARFTRNPFPSSRGAALFSQSWSVLSPSGPIRPASVPCGSGTSELQDTWESRIQNPESIRNESRKHETEHADGDEKPAQQPEREYEDCWYPNGFHSHDPTHVLAKSRSQVSRLHITTIASCHDGLYPDPAYPSATQVTGISTNGKSERRDRVRKARRVLPQFPTHYIGKKNCKFISVFLLVPRALEHLHFPVKLEISSYRRGYSTCSTLSHAFQIFIGRKVSFHACLWER